MGVKFVIRAQVAPWSVLRQMPALLVPNVRRLAIITITNMARTSAPVIRETTAYVLNPVRCGA